MRWGAAQWLCSACCERLGGLFIEMDVEMGAKRRVGDRSSIGRRVPPATPHFEPSISLEQPPVNPENWGQLMNER
jgi:hypothetical protein